MNLKVISSHEKKCKLFLNVQVVGFTKDQSAHLLIVVYLK